MEDRAVLPSCYHKGREGGTRRRDTIKEAYGGSQGGGFTGAVLLGKDRGGLKGGCYQKRRRFSPGSTAERSPARREDGGTPSSTALILSVSFALAPATSSTVSSSNRAALAPPPPSLGGLLGGPPAPTPLAWEEGETDAPCG